LVLAIAASEELRRYQFIERTNVAKHSCCCWGGCL